MKECPCLGKTAMKSTVVCGAEKPSIYTVVEASVQRKENVAALSLLVLK